MVVCFVIFLVKWKFFLVCFRFGHVFSADTGTSVGEIMGQSKPLNSVDFRGDRPFRIVTASEDNTLAFFHGPPFKFQFTLQVQFMLNDDKMSCEYFDSVYWNVIMWDACFNIYSGVIFKRHWPVFVRILS